MTPKDAEILIVAIMKSGKALHKAESDLIAVLMAAGYRATSRQGIVLQEIYRRVYED